MVSGLTSGLGTQFCRFCTVFDQSGGDEAWQTRLSSHVLCFFYHHIPPLSHYPCSFSCSNAKVPWAGGRWHRLGGGQLCRRHYTKDSVGPMDPHQPVDPWSLQFSNEPGGLGEGILMPFLLIPTIWSVCMDAIWLYMTDGLLICCVLNPKCVTLWPYFKNNHSFVFLMTSAKRSRRVGQILSRVWRFDPMTFYSTESD